MESIIGILFSGLITWFVAWYFAIPDRKKRIKSLSNYKTKENDWICVWQEKPKDKIWIEDEMILTKKFGTIYFTSLKNSNNYHWEIKGKIINHFLVGEYYSLKPNSYSTGGLSLKIQPQGNIMVGYWCGTSNTTKLYNAKIIICKKNVNINEIKKNFNQLI